MATYELLIKTDSNVGGYKPEVELNVEKYQVDRNHHQRLAVSLVQVAVDVSIVPICHLLAEAEPSTCLPFNKTTWLFYC